MNTKNTNKGPLLAELVHDVHLVFLSNNTLFFILSLVGGCSLFGFAFVRRCKKSGTNSNNNNNNNEGDNEGNNNNEGNNSNNNSNNNIPVSVRLMQTVRIMAEKPMLYLYLAMIYSGVSQTVMSGVFPATRPQGEVGYIMTAFGAADVLGSFVAGYLSDKIGRLPILLTCAASFTIGSMLFLLQTVNVVSDYKVVSYIIAIFFGVADSGFNTQIYAMIGVVFPGRVESAIGGYKFLQSGAAATLYFLGPYVSELFYFLVANALLWSGTLFFFFLSRLFSLPAIIIRSDTKLAEMEENEENEEIEEIEGNEENERNEENEENEEETMEIISATKRGNAIV